MENTEPNGKPEPQEKIEPFTIEFQGYNLEDSSVVVIKKLFEKFPLISRKKAAEHLGVSERNLYRLIKKHNLFQCLGKRKGYPLTVENAISLLKSEGYIIEKK